MKTKYLLYSIIAFVILPGFIAAQDKIDLLILNKQYKEALQQIDREIGKNPSAQLYVKKGLVFNNLQNYQEAVVAYSEALKIDSTNVEILAEIAETLSILGNYQDANYYFHKAINIQPENYSLLAKLGKNYINLKDYNNAYNCFSVIYKKDSTNVYWNKQFAFCAFKVGKKQQAINLYEKVLQQNPRDYSSYFNLLRIYDKKDDHVKILDLIEKGLSNFPDDADFYGERARLYFETKDYKGAKTDYENYFTAHGDSVYQILMNYGIASYFEKDEKNAINALDVCAGLTANDPIVLFYLSLSHKRLNDFEISEQYMNAAIESATPYYLPDMYHHLGQILGMQRKFPESIAALQKANELDPTNAEALFEIATTYEEYNSNKTLALNYYRIYLKEAGEGAKNADYALTRITKLKEDLFFEE